MATLKEYLQARIVAAGIDAGQLSRAEWWDELAREWRTIPWAAFKAAADAVTPAQVSAGARSRLRLVLSTPQGERFLMWDGAAFVVDDGSGTVLPFTVADLTG